MAIQRLFQISKKVLGFFIPGGVVFLAALIFLRNGYLDSWLPLITGSLPYIILAIGFLLGLRFHRGRLALALLILIFTDRILYYFGPGGVVASGHETVILQAISFLLPINMALLYFDRERALLSPFGLIRLCFILAQPVAVYILLKYKLLIFGYLNKSIISLSFLDRIDMPQAVLVSYGIVLFLFFTISLISNNAIQRGFFWALLASAVALQSKYGGGETTIYICVAGIILILSVIETAYAMAYQDELTGLPGRRSLNTSLQTLGKHYTIAMLDIDFFKKFNDKYGHDVGDQVLCMVASHIRRVEGGGKPFRYGGEEFTVIFPGKSKTQAHPFLENLRKSIAEAKFKVRGKNRPKVSPKRKVRAKNPKTVSVTISIGAAEPGRNLNNPAEVIKAADSALYRAKKKGRNCVVS